MRGPSFITGRNPVGVLLIAVLLLLENGCALAPVSGVVGPGVTVPLYALTHPDSIKRTAAAVGKTFKDITPEQEYYIGRSVAATVLKHYPPYADKQANRYVNLVGQSLAQASERPETFGGYHFLILDSEELNAFAAPGGLIFVTRGILRTCAGEDELAAVLAHEISHIEKNHGLSAIKQDRLVSALGILASEGTKALSGGQLTLVVEAFEKTVGDVASTVLQRSYSREAEREADGSTVAILRRVGYDPRAFVNLLREMDKDPASRAGYFAKTHPDIEARIRTIEARITTPSTDAPQKRKARFKGFLARV